MLKVKKVLKAIQMFKMFVFLYSPIKEQQNLII